MSFGIYWRPEPPPNSNQLPQGFKYILANKYFGGDGSMRGETYLNGHARDYLQGVLDASTHSEVREGARELINAIAEHTIIRVWIGTTMTKFLRALWDALLAGLGLKQL